MTWWSSLFMGLGAFAASACQIFMSKDTGKETEPGGNQKGSVANGTTDMVTWIKNRWAWFAGAAVLIILLLLFSRRK